MPYTKRILCLANSDMGDNRCIAGKELLANGPQLGRWIRLVSSRENPGVGRERLYIDSTEPCVLDVMDVPVLKEQPINHQQENWLLDTKHRLKKVGRVPANKLKQFTDLTDPIPRLWIDGHSSDKGQNDKIPWMDTRRLDRSLCLIKVDRLSFVVSQPGINFGNDEIKVQGAFRYNGTDYRLQITDLIYKEKYQQKGNGRYPIGECFLTVSLPASPYKDDYAYKLIAAVIET